MVQLPIVHWNDVYRVRPQKIDPTSSETIDSTQFAALLDDIRDKWPERSDGKKDGLSLFSGDVFAPSVESSVTRGSHMVSPIIHLRNMFKDSLREPCPGMPFWTPSLAFRYL